MRPFAVSMREKRVSVGCGATVIVSVTGGVGVDIMGELVVGDSEERIEIEVFAGVISNHDIRFMSGLSIATIDQACISVFGDVSIIIFTPVASRARESIGSTIIGDSVVHFREIGSIGISVETISADEVLLDSGTPLTTNQTELSAKSISPPISKDTIVSALTEEFPWSWDTHDELATLGDVTVFSRGTVLVFWIEIIPATPCEVLPHCGLPPHVTGDDHWGLPQDHPVAPAPADHPHTGVLATEGGISESLVSPVLIAMGVFLSRKRLSKSHIEKSYEQLQSSRIRKKLQNIETLFHKKKKLI